MGNGRAGREGGKGGRKGEKEGWMKENHKGSYEKNEWRMDERGNKRENIMVHTQGGKRKRGL